jgi:ABC-type phosphate/phosphonate transport system substrate-binding protein
MLTGHPPFHAATPLETLRQVAEEEPKHPSSFNAAVDRDLATICLKCLEKDPRRRYGTAEALAEDLDRWLRREPIEARPVRAVGRLWRWCRREPKLAGMAAGLFLLLAASAVLGLTLYQREKDRLTKSEEAKARQLSALLNRVVREWDKEGSTGVRITAEELALRNKRILTMDGSEIVVALGLSTARRDSKPVRVIERFAPLLEYLQTNLATRAGPQVLLELHIYAGHASALAGFLKGEVHLLRCDPASYVLIRQKDPRIIPVVQQSDRGRPEQVGVIFTRADTGIARLEDLRGRSFTFGSPDSAITWYLPKAELVAAGLTARELRPATNMVTGLVPTFVRTGRLDAGAADSGDVTDLIKAGASLRILKEMRCPHWAWVATPKLDPAIRQAIQEYLLALHDIDLLAAIDPSLTAFSPAGPSDYDALERQMEQAKRFDQPPVQGPP